MFAWLLWPKVVFLRKLLVPEKKAKGCAFGVMETEAMAAIREEAVKGRAGAIVTIAIWCTNSISATANYLRHCGIQFVAATQ